MEIAALVSFILLAASWMVLPSSSSAPAVEERAHAVPRAAAVAKA